MVTRFLSLLAIAGIALMLYAVVALPQDRRLFGAAPKDAQASSPAKARTVQGTTSTGLDAYHAGPADTLHFFQHYFPELEGLESYTKYGFNLKSQIIRIIIYPFICALAAWTCTLI